VLTHPFDAELQSIVGRFGALLRSIVATVDEHGLRRRHLRRHASLVAQFFPAPLTREEGLKDYLVLLSLFQTWPIQGCQFLAIPAFEAEGH
jgi:hypothetical protein